MCYNGGMEGFYALVAFALAWLIAQTVKVVLGALEGKKIGEKINFGTVVDYFTRSGGMPSGHAASFMALTIYLGCVDGFTSGIFALALCTWAIIVYDATHVRYAVGEHGKALNSLLVSEHSETRVKVVEGHTIAQVVVGTLIGLGVGFLVFMCFKP